MNADTSTVRRVAPGTRAILIAFSLLTLLATSQLYLLSNRTRDSFAWTVQPSLTAAFLGAGFASGFVLVSLSLAARLWAHIRLAYLTIFVFTMLTLVATLLHLNEFHWIPGESTRFARLAALFWLIIYVAVPIAMVGTLRGQLRAPGSDPPRRAPLPRWIGLLLVAQGLTLLPIGALLFLIPEWAAEFWPWQLNPLTARAIAAWLLAIGVAAGLGLREHDSARLQTPAIAYTVFAVLQLIAIARYPSALRWNEPAAWLYLSALAGMGLAGAAGWQAAAHRRARKEVTRS